ncbi:hypothetical protein DFJ74DRAFT_716789 [Hyaloraphidium curvatum]|nr:hypothetical protein DFJ74DRAFT_716789 [Hyaloraphidium curvatum]
MDAPKQTFGSAFSALHAAVLDVIAPVVLLWNDALYSLLHLFRIVPAFHVTVPSRSSRPAVFATGASSGIGKAFVISLLADGYTVLAGVRHIAEGDDLKGEVAKAGMDSSRLVPIEIDVAVPEHIERAAVAATSFLSASDTPLIAVINVAGGALCAPLEIVPIEAYRRQLEIEVVGRHLVAQAFMPMLRQSKGRLINVGSAGGWNFAPGFGAYHIAKAAIAAESMVLRKEMAKFEVAVSLVEPGGIGTPAFAKALAGFDPKNPQGFSNYDGAIPLDHQRASEYAPLLKQCAATAAGMDRVGLPPREVVRVLRHALRSPWPQDRYRVGLDAWGLHWVKAVMPSWVGDVVGLRSW